MAGNEITIAPLRSLDEFLLGSARFQLPNFKDVDKWANRVNQNLVYYQSNYFLMSLFVFMLVGFAHPVKMIFGIGAMCIAFALFYYVTNAKHQATQFKKDHPVISLILIICGAYLIVHLLNSVLVFLFGMLLPIVLIFLHASMRLRSLKNKVNNKFEMIGLKTSPMGAFLLTLGQEIEFL